jgi:ketosteroid isomerase-like protein
MAEEIVSVVREGLDRFNRGDLEGALEQFSPDVEWDTTGAVPDGQTYRGREEVLAYWRSIAERWNDFRIEADEWIAADDVTVLMLGRLRGVGTESGVPIEHSWDQVWRLRGNEVVVCENYTQRERAMAAAGVGGG